MGEYLYPLLWIAAWPALIYVAYRFIRLNTDELTRRGE